MDPKGNGKKGKGEKDATNVAIGVATVDPQGIDPEPTGAPQGEPQGQPEAQVSKSAQIRRLLDDGKTISEVADIVGVRYNFVYNVASRHMDKLPTRQQEGKSQSARIREMLDEGKTVTEIKKALGLDYNFVYGVKTAYDRKKAQQSKEQ
jgi:hypothetical protein